MIMRKKRGQDEVSFHIKALIKAKRAHTVPRVFLVLLCATVLAWIWEWQRSQKHGYKSLHRGRSVWKAASSQAPAGMAETLRSSALNPRSLALSAVHQGL